MTQVHRSALIDCTKGLACAAIVWHHLAFYGPMSDVARQAMPEVIDWLGEYARMAVQVFLVLGGFLAAASLAPRGHARFDDPWPRNARRFVRLVVPYTVALVVAIVVQAAVRPWFDHPSVSEDPTLWQLLAHALLLHGVLGEESLSAGVWYVAIDFQLFALTTLLLAGVTRLAATLRMRWGGRALARCWPWAMSGGRPWCWPAWRRRCCTSTWTRSGTCGPCTSSAPTGSACWPAGPCNRPGPWAPGAGQCSWRPWCWRRSRWNGGRA